MSLRTRLLIVSFILAIAGWFVWKNVVGIYNAPGKSGDLISTVVRENFFSFTASGKTRLSCKFLPLSELAFIDAEHTAAIDSETNSYFEKREGRFLAEAPPRVKLIIDPIDQKHSDAIHTKTDLTTFEQANHRFMEAFFQLGWVVGPVVFNTDSDKIRSLDLVYVKNYSSGEFQLTRDLKTLHVKMASDGTAMTLRFDMGVSGRRVPVSGTFVSPSFPYGIKFDVTYEFRGGVEIPATIGTTILKAAGETSGPALVDKFTDCVAE